MQAFHSLLKNEFNTSVFYKNYGAQTLLSYQSPGTDSHISSLRRAYIGQFSRKHPAALVTDVVTMTSQHIRIRNTPASDAALATMITQPLCRKRLALITCQLLEFPVTFHAAD